jgi:PKD domain
MVRVTGGNLMAERAVTLDGPPPVPPPNPAPPVPPNPTLPTPGPSLAVTLSASAPTTDIFSAVTFTATATPHNGAGPATSYDWDFNGDGTLELSGTPSNIENYQYPTIGAMTAIVTAHAGTIVGSGQTIVTVTAPPLAVSISATPAGPYNTATAVTFTATVTSLGPLPSTFHWDWDLDDDPTPNVIHQGSIPTDSVTYTFSATGTHDIRVKVTDPATGRSATATRPITIN